MSLISKNIKFNIEQIFSGIVSPEVYPVSSYYPIANGTTKQLNRILYILISINVLPILNYLREDLIQR